MVHNKRSKNSRQRGSWTHGWGEKKKHRGAGHRGGRGKAGSGKKGDAKKTKFWKDLDYFGKKGFTSLNKEEHNTINVSNLNQLAAKMLKAGKATETSGTIKINLTELGYTKLLGTGKTAQKFEITISAASEAAIAKIAEAGGKVIGIQATSEEAEQ